MKPPVTRGGQPSEGSTTSSGPRSASPGPVESAFAELASAEKPKTSVVPKNPEPVGVAIQSDIKTRVAATEEQTQESSSAIRKGKQTAQHLSVAVAAPASAGPSASANTASMSSTNPKPDSMFGAQQSERNQPPSWVQEGLNSSGYGEKQVPRLLANVSLIASAYGSTSLSQPILRTDSVSAGLDEKPLAAGLVSNSVGDIKFKSDVPGQISNLTPSSAISLTKDAPPNSTVRKSEFPAWFPHPNVGEIPSDYLSRLTEEKASPKAQALASVLGGKSFKSGLKPSEPTGEVLKANLGNPVVSPQAKPSQSESTLQLATTTSVEVAKSSTQETTTMTDYSRSNSEATSETFLEVRLTSESKKSLQTAALTSASTPTPQGDKVEEISGNLLEKNNVRAQAVKGGQASAAAAEAKQQPASQSQPPVVLVEVPNPAEPAAAKQVPAEVPVRSAEKQTPLPGESLEPKKTVTAETATTPKTSSKSAPKSEDWIEAASHTGALSQQVAHHIGDRTTASTKSAPTPTSSDKEFRVDDSSNRRDQGRQDGQQGQGKGDQRDQGQPREQFQKAGKGLLGPAASPLLVQVSVAQELRRLDVYRQFKTEEAVKIGLKSETQLDGKKIQELTVRHAPHSIASLLKKAYRTDLIDHLDEHEVVNCFGLILKMGGEFTYAHSARVLEMAMDLADEMGIKDPQTRKEISQGSLFKDIGEAGLAMDNLPQEKIAKMGDFLSSEDMRRAGLLHDIGKVRIPPEILYKPGKLTDEEYTLMKMHPVYGEQMLYPISSMRHLCPVIRGHHERWDGKGYPDGLSGENIPLAARVIAVADVFDALHAERPYKAAMPIAKVRSILEEGAGTHFDPDLVKAFGRVLDRRYPELSNPFA